MDLPDGRIVSYACRQCYEVGEKLTNGKEKDMMGVKDGSK